MVEQELKVVEVGKYVNLNIKPKPLKGIKGLDNGNYVVVEKVREVETKSDFGISHLCIVKYKGVECSFFLNEKEYPGYSAVGGIGDKVKITLTKEPYINKKTGVEQIANKLTFEGV
jgi:hypothetical protein